MESHMDALLGVSAKGSDVAANNIVPAQLTVEAKLKAAGATDKAVAGSSLNSKVSSRSYSSSLREDYSAYSSERGAAGAVAEKPYPVAAIANRDSLVNNNLENSTDQLVNNNLESSTDQLVNNNLESSTDQLVDNNLESLTEQLLDISLASK
jgi:hypothetical protein